MSKSGILCRRFTEMIDDLPNSLADLLVINLLPRLQQGYVLRISCCFYLVQQEHNHAAIPVFKVTHVERVMTRCTFRLIELRYPSDPRRCRIR